MESVCSECGTSVSEVAAPVTLNDSVGSYSVGMRFYVCHCSQDVSLSRFGRSWTSEEQRGYNNARYRSARRLRNA